MVMLTLSGDKTPPDKDPPKVELTAEILDQMRRRRQMLAALRRWDAARQRPEGQTDGR